MVNAKTIVKFASVYPFKMTMRHTTLGCVYCKEVFELEQPENYRSHVDTEHAHLDKSDAISISPYARLTRIDVSVLSCKICSQTFPTIEVIARHLKEAHALPIDLNESLGLVPIKLDSEDFECVVCRNKFDSFVKLSRHMTSHFALNICHVCGRKMETRYCYHRQPSSPSNKVFCNKCKQSFPSLDARRLHYKTSQKCLAHKCRECGERFASGFIRQRHRVETHGRPNRIFPCTKCDQTFPYQTLLNKHYNSTHSNVYRCQYCEQRFWSNPSLECHIARVHTLEKAYQCEYCENSYFEKRHLKNHLRKHDDSMKFHCKVCGRMFVRKYLLRDHILKSHVGVGVEDI